MDSKHGELSSNTSAGEAILTDCCSERKWKMQLKDWGFEKYVSASDMRILIAKAEKRAKEENKDTIFFNGECQIPQEKIDLFKRRKLTKQTAPASPSAGMQS
jgi:hypothetical protein